MNQRRFWVYILANERRTVLYTGITNSLELRVGQHRNGFGSQFAHRYNATRLVYAAEFIDVREAIAFEKQLKATSRRRKVRLIEEANPEWLDFLAEEREPRAGSGAEPKSGR
jgi:putative endonuclease